MTQRMTDQPDFHRHLEEIRSRITRQIETQERERTETARHLGLMLEKLEKYAETLSTDLQGQLDRRIATNHRELADAVRHLESLITAGDAALRQHVLDQVGQVQLALEAGDKLTIARVAEVQKDLDSWKVMAIAEHEAIRRESDIVRQASEKAIEKSEAAVKERLTDANRFREQILEERGQYALREAVDQQVKALSEQIGAVVGRVDRVEGERRGISSTVGTMIAVASVLLAAVVVVVNVLLA